FGALGPRTQISGSVDSSRMATVVTLVLIGVAVIIIARLARHNARLVDELDGVVAKLADTEEALAQQGRRDPLTGLDTRRAYDEAIQSSMARMRRYGEQFYIVTVDVDHFKRL